MLQANMTGGRLAFVVRELQGTVKREKTRMVLIKKGNGKIRDQYEMKTVVEEEPAGFMVYFPRGHVVRIPNRKLLEHYRLHLKPRIINLEGLSDPNTPLGKMMMAQDDQTRAGAMIDMERMVIQLACAKTGPQLMPEQVIEREAA
jgi:hypothetical protein